MQLSDMIRVSFWRLIATPRTNLCRQADSVPNSKENLANVEAFQHSGGWSAEFPAVIVSMANWPFGKTLDNPTGITAQQYIDDEMRARRAKYQSLKDAPDYKEKVLHIEAFEEIFGYHDEEDDYKFKFHELTIENAYWVNSGHQRTEFVFVPAYYLYKERKAANYAAQVEKGIEVQIEEPFNLAVPSIVGTYTDLQDILANQMKGNTSVKNQNGLSPKDYLKSAILCIGRGAVQKMGERDFRNFCSESGVDGAKANSGGAPRYAYLLACINFFYRGALKFAEGLLAPAEITVDGNTVPNTEYIDFADIAVKHVDPTSDASVMARVMEPSLEKLKNYIREYGPNGSRLKGEQLKLPNGTASELELVVFKREKCFSQEEALAWVKTKHKFDVVNYKKPAVAVATAKFDVEAIKPFITSDGTSNIVRDLLGDLTGTPKAAGEVVPTGIVAKTTAMRDNLDAVWKLDPNNERDAKFLAIMLRLDVLRDGFPDGYDTALSGIESLLVDIEASVPAGNAGTQTPESGTEGSTVASGTTESGVNAPGSTDADGSGGTVSATGESETSTAVPAVDTPAVDVPAIDAVPSEATKAKRGGNRGK